MSLGGVRRIWTRVEVQPLEAGFTLMLDDRPLRTPAKAPLAMPTRALAEAVAAEWDAVTDKVNPDAMPMTRAVNSALDKVIPNQAAVSQLLTEYGGSDLLCYRADAPEELAFRQQEKWTPWVDWSRDTLVAPLILTAGVIPVDQPPSSVARLRAAVDAHDAFELTALHDLVTLSGSLILALAVSRGALEASAAWSLSRLDEDWQQSLWGIDPEAAAAAAVKSAAFDDAARLLKLVRG